MNFFFHARNLSDFLSQNPRLAAKSTALTRSSRIGLYKDKISEKPDTQANVILAMAACDISDKSCRHTILAALNAEFVTDASFTPVPRLFTR